jgi:hypothetical protein
MTITAQSIIRRATDLLQDQDSVRWPVNELVRWLNDAQRAIIKVRPDTMNTTATMRLAVGTRQSLMSGTAAAGVAALSPVPSKLIEITRNMAASSAKQAVRQIERALMDRQSPEWHSITPVIDVRNYMFDERDPRCFYVYPPATSASELEVMYSAYPTDITEPANGSLYTAISGNVSLPDIYADDLLHLVLAKAYMKDSEYAGDVNRAASYVALVTASLGAEIAATLAVKPRMKPGAQAAGA